MKYFAVVVGLVLACALLPARAQQNADDQFIAIYNLIQQADSLQAVGQARPALDDYKQALSQLQDLQKSFPDWDPKIVTYRLGYLNDRISGLSKLFPAGVEAGTPVTNAPPVFPVSSAERQLNALRIQTEGLQAENQLLQAKLKEAWRTRPAIMDPQALAQAQAQVLTLMKENDLLRASLMTGATTNATPDTLAKLREALTESDKKLAEQASRVDKLAQENQALQSETSVSELEKAALEERLKQRRTVPAPAPETASGEVKVLRARLAVAEARPVPYTPEELALMKAPPPAPATNAAVGERSSGKLPAGSAPLVAEAQNYFLNGQFDKAEADYHRLLELDPNNAMVLANLAAIELQEDKLDEADRHITAALKLNPDDPFNLSTLGFLKFRQEKYDEALDALSRAAKLDPASPQILNYLGVTLSHKGLQAEAETALRRAIEIAPNYAAAQNNLAVIYLNANPPSPALARLHYQTALELGQPRNPDLEKKLADLGAPVNK